MISDVALVVKRSNQYRYYGVLLLRFPFGRNVEEELCLWVEKLDMREAPPSPLHMLQAITEYLPMSYGTCYCVLGSPCNSVRAPCRQCIDRAFVGTMGVA